MQEQLDLFSNTTEQENNPVHKASAMLLERRLKPPAVIMQNEGGGAVVHRGREISPEKTSGPDQRQMQDLPELAEPVALPDEIIDQRISLTASADSGSDQQLAASLPATDILPLKEISDITPVTVSDFSEPIAIIAVKPVEEVKPKAARGRKSIKEMSMEADLPQVPEDEKLFSKQYYGIGEVATMFHVNASLLRYWETEFDVLKPRKNGKGDRFFRPEDIKNLQIIHHLLRQKKFTIQGAKDYLKNNKQSKEKFEMVKQLQQLRTFLLEMKAGL